MLDLTQATENELQTAIRSGMRESQATADDYPSIASQFPCDSFEVPGFPKILWEPMSKVTERGSIRENPRVVPFVNGEQIDESGLAADYYDVEIGFFNDVSQRIPEIGKEPKMYPDRLELMRRIVKSRKTGTLNLFGRKAIRAKAINWEIGEQIEQLDGAWVRVTFKTDNEGKLDETTVSRVAVAANLQQSANRARFFASEQGADLVPLFDALNTATSQLETALRTPETMRSDLESKAFAVRYNVERIQAALSSNTDGRDQCNHPMGEPLAGELFNLRMLAIDAENDGRTRGVRTKAIRFDVMVSIWEIATRIGMPGDELLALNPQIGNPNAIEPRTAVFVPEDRWPPRAR